MTVTNRQKDALPQTSLCTNSARPCRKSISQQSQNTSARRPSSTTSRASWATRSSTRTRPLKSNSAEGSVSSYGLMSQAQVAKYVLSLRDAQDTFLRFPGKAALPRLETCRLPTRTDRRARQTRKEPTRYRQPAHHHAATSHAKSTFGTVLFPSYYMARNPNRYTMSCSYNSQLATDFGRQIRTVVEEKCMTQAFPDFGLSKDSRAVDVWRTDQAAAHTSQSAWAAPHQADQPTSIVDDPVKSREDAESMTQRNKTWNYYTSALATRLPARKQRHAPQTNHHPDPLAPRRPRWPPHRKPDWKEGRWTHVNFSAIKKVHGHKISRRDLPKDHPKYLDSGELHKVSPAQRKVHSEEEAPLWPERFPLDELKRRQRLNPREFASLYQQQPYVEGGNIIKTEWWRKYPADLSPENFVTLVIGVDTAFKKQKPPTTPWP